MTKELKDLNLKIEKLLDSEKVYLDKIHNFKEKERYLESKVHDLEWKIKYGISKEGYINLMIAKTGQPPSQSSLDKFDEADINKDNFLTFKELQMFCCSDSSL